MANKQKSGGGARKIGRNKTWCAAYRLRGTEARNKARNIETERRRQIRNAKKLARRASNPTIVARLKLHREKKALERCFRD
jgi:hypothetical protein